MIILGYRNEDGKFVEIDYQPSKRETAYIKTMHNNMLYRCQNHPTYKNVKVCDEWKEFDYFLDWVVHQPNWNYADKNNLSLSRHLDIGDYTLTNVKFTTKADNKFSKYWCITEPTGETVIIKNLCKYANDRSLSPHYFYQLANKKTKSDCLYKVIKLEVAA